MFAQEHKYLTQSRQPEQIMTAEVGKIDGDDAVKHFQQSLSGVALSEYDEGGEQQKLEEKEKDLRYFAKSCLLKGLPACKEIALGAVHAKRHGKGVVEQVGIYDPQIEKTGQEHHREQERPAVLPVQFHKQREQDDQYDGEAHVPPGAHIRRRFKQFCQSEHIHQHIEDGGAGATVDLKKAARWKADEDDQQIHKYKVGQQRDKPVSRVGEHVCGGRTEIRVLLL